MKRPTQFALLTWHESGPWRHEVLRNPIAPRPYILKVLHSGVVVGAHAYRSEVQAREHFERSVEEHTS